MPNRRTASANKPKHTTVMTTQASSVNQKPRRGSSKGNAHLLNFKALVAPYFDEILIVSGHQIEGHAAIQLDFGLKHPLRILKNVRALRTVIRDFNPDVIHVHQANSYGLITTLANRCFKPLVLTTWGSDVL